MRVCVRSVFSQITRSVFVDLTNSQQFRLNLRSTKEKKRGEKKNYAGTLKNEGNRTSGAQTCFQLLLENYEQNHFYLNCKGHFFITERLRDSRFVSSIFFLLKDMKNLSRLKRLTKRIENNLASMETRCRDSSWTLCLCFI